MWNSRERLVPRPPVILRLEQLEDRNLMSSSGGIGPESGAVVPPPSQFQATLSLVIDGAYLKTLSLMDQYLTNFGANRAALDEFPGVPSITADATARAAAAGINFNALISLNSFLGGMLFSKGVTTAQTDIQSNWPYAGPYAPFALIAGAEAAVLAVQQPPTNNIDP